MKKLSLTLTLVLISTVVFAQQDRFHWRFGLKSGIMTYFGDLNSRAFPANQSLIDKDLDFLSHGLVIEKRLKQSSSLRLSLSKGQFIANDRAIDFKGKLIDSKNFDRSLNAKTTIKDIGLHYTWHSDNDRLFSQKAFLSPYAGIGLGLSSFEVFGDVLTSEGNRYHYWSDGTIRDMAEASGTGNIINQDGIFETNLTRLNTEDKSYATRAWFGSALIGLKLRLNARFNLNFEYQWNYTSTDYLDDVSGEFQTLDNGFANYAANPANSSGKRGNNSKMNDSYSFLSFSLHYNLGKRKTPFRAPELLTAWASTSEETTTVNVKPEILQALPHNIDGNSIQGAVSKSGSTKIGHLEESAIISKNDSIHSYFKPKGIYSYYSTLLGFMYFDSTGNWVNPDAFDVASVNTAKQMIEDTTIEDPVVKVVVDSSANETRETPVFNIMPTENSMLENKEGLTVVSSADSVLGTLKGNNKSAAFEIQPTEGNAIEAKADSKTLVSSTVALDTQMQHDLIALKAKMDVLIQLYGNQQQANPTATKVAMLRTELAQLKSELASGYQADSSSIDSLSKVKPLANYQMNENGTALLMIQSQLLQLNQRIDGLVQQRTQATQVVSSDAKPSSMLLEEIKELKAKTQAVEQQLIKNEQATKTLESQVTTERDASINEKFNLYKKTVIYFGNNLSTLSSTDMQRLDAVIQYLDTQSFSIVIRGYTDQVGDAKYNGELALKRAITVKSYFTAKGISADKILIDHTGPDTTIGYQQASYGRRVEVLLR